MPDDKPIELRSIPTTRPRARSPIPPLTPPVAESDAGGDREIETARAETLDRMMHAWQARFTHPI